jgi:adenylosuccinate lyase
MELLKADADVTAKMTAAEIEERFNLDYHFKHIDTIFDRVFG